MVGKQANDGWSMSILVPEDPGASLGDRSGAPRTKGFLRSLFGGKEVVVPAATVTSQWSETISGLMATVNGWEDVANGRWQVDEVNVGLTLSAEGKLLFIASAGVEGSIQVKLARAGGASGKSR
jgi:hypothetical protein